MRRVALIAGISLGALLSVTTVPAGARTVDIESWWGRAGSRSGDRSPAGISKSHRTNSERGKPAEQTAPLPAGPLTIIVSIDAQRATLFAGVLPVASTAISSGTHDHPTPMGVFTVIQKDRYHISNLYDAPMPYMQRITWSGSALHQGPLPGYPASHGCVRLTTEFAQLLWRTTKLGARVIVTRPTVAPIEFESPRLALFKPRPLPPPPSEPPASPLVTSSVVKSVDAEPNSPALPAGGADAKPVDSQPTGNAQIDQPTKLSASSESKPIEQPATPVQTAGLVKPELATPRSIIVDSRLAAATPTTVRAVKPKPISVFVSLKEHKLYVRQGWQPLFDVPVTIHRPDEPIGTHVYTAMGTKSDGDLRWTAISIPSSYKHAAAPKPVEHRHKGRNDATIKSVEVAPPMPSAGAALDRIEIAPDVADRIAALMMPGSSLIVSDNKLSDETDESTDFIVLTR